MRAVDIIRKKRDGQALTPDEIKWFINAYTRDDVPDYQAAALLMAVYFQGMSREETVELTLAMAQSGRLNDLSGITDYAVDKHSSGGVGDKTSLIVLPLVAACGVTVAKMSGRGLGFSGGTLDKLESIPGFNVNLSDEQFKTQTQEIGIVLAGQTQELAPADGKLYALRDVTATIASIPLIAASIMSKKLASGAQGIVLDVKVGTGAFMQSLDEARRLAETMVAIGVDAGRDMVALLSDMNQPLGQAVGNALEVREAIDILRGGGPDDLREHCIEIARHMLHLAGQGQKWTDSAAVRHLLLEKLRSGAAFDVFRNMVAAQGGDTAVVDDPSLLPRAAHIQSVKAAQSGYVARADALSIAWASLALGAGREKKGDKIDLAVGLEVLVNVGDAVRAGDDIVRVHANDPAKMAQAMALLHQAIDISADPVEPLPLFYGTITGDSVGHQGR